MAQLDPEVQAQVRLWIVPRARHCPLWLTRLVLWLRFAAVAAVLEGPLDGCLVRHGRNGRRMDSYELALHLRDLVARGRFPDGPAPVLLTGVTEQGLVEVRAALALPGPVAAPGPAWSEGDRGRLRSYAFSLSELQRSGRALDRGAFVQNPLGQSGHLLVQRCAAALERVGLPHVPTATALGAPGLAGDAARRLLLWT